MIELKKHNVVPYNELCEKLEAVKKCAFISATGTGKTYVIGKYIEDHNLVERTLILVPSKNIRKVWKSILPEIRVQTYHWLHSKAKSCESLMHEHDIKLIVCDEMHHLGATEWGRVYQELTKGFSGMIIGATATPIRFLDKGRNMVEECFEGEMVEGLSLPDAISAGILPSMDYTTALYNLPQHIPGNKRGIQSEYTENLYRQLDYLNSQHSFKRILSDKLSDGIKHKVAVFVDTIDRIPEIKCLCEDIFPGAAHFVAHSRQTEAENEKAFANFSSDINMCFIYTVNMLNEGAHIKGVDTVVMFRKTESPLIYLQQIGRALTTDADKDRIKVFDFVANHTSIKVVANGSGSVIQWMRENISDKERQIVVNDYALKELELLEKLRDLLNGGWTKEEDRLIFENYNQEDGLEILRKLLPHRTSSAIRNRAKVIGAAPKRKSFEYWSERENNILREVYNQGKGLADAARLMPNRTRDAIQRRACYLGLAQPYMWRTEQYYKDFKELYPKEGGIEKLRDKYPNMTQSAMKRDAKKLGVESPNAAHPWTEQEEQILTDNPHLPIEALTKLIPRHSRGSIILRRSKLGLSRKNLERWTESEDAVLRNNQDKPNEYIQMMYLPNRTVDAIKTRRHNLGLSSWRYESRNQNKCNVKENEQ